MTSINDVYQYGDVVSLTEVIDIGALLKDLKMFDSDWSQYNPNKPWINRQGLCVLNERGEVGPGPALDSIYNYNNINGTKWTEYDFNKPTDVYHISKTLQGLLEQKLSWCVRTHFLKLLPGGYFPPHRDHIRGKQNVFRLIIPVQNCNPPGMRFMIEDKTYHWEYGRVYMVNTTKAHCLFNMANQDSIWLVINSVICDDSIEYVASNLQVT